MFKKLLTTMLVLALAVSAGSAFAGDMEWTFYGKLHSSINMLSNGENSQLGVTSNTSRFGFRGWKPMNDDFTFVWQFESGLDMVHKNGTPLATRNSYIGFKNEDFGQVRLGIHDTPHKTLGRKTTFFFDTIGDNRQMTFGTDTRERDILAWVSPDWDGFSLFLAYQFDQDGSKLSSTAASTAEFHAETAFSGMASYAKDEYFLGVSTLMLSEGYADDDGAGNYGDAPMALRFAGKYMAEQFGVCASFLNVSSQEWDGSAFVDMTMSTLGFEGMYKANEKYAIKAGYYMADPNTDVDNDDFSLMTFGVDRTFTKNVMMYLQYAALSYGDASYNWQLGGGGNGFGQQVMGWENTTTTPMSYENPYGFSVGATVTW